MPRCSLAFIRDNESYESWTSCRVILGTNFNSPFVKLKYSHLTRYSSSFETFQPQMVSILVGDGVNQLSVNWDKEGLMDAPTKP